MSLVKTETYDRYDKEKLSDNDSIDRRHDIHPCFNAEVLAERLKPKELEVDHED